MINFFQKSILYFFSKKIVLLNLVIFIYLLVYEKSYAVSLNNWMKIDSDGKYLINQLLLPRDRHLRKVMEIQNLLSTSVDGVNSMELLTEYDCKKATFRLLSHRAYSSFNLRGDLVYDWQGIDPRAFVGIPNGTPTQKILYFVCGYDRKTTFKIDD
tara:strand:- start:34 stop:501 length:468 start_codon:yes stop_codon:yes gene_type:complete